MKRRRRFIDSPWFFRTSPPEPAMKFIFKINVRFRAAKSALFDESRIALKKAVIDCGDLPLCGVFKQGF
jgi:hypothetical protein